MACERFKPEEIVAKLRHVEVLQGQGSTVVDAIRQIGVTEVTYYRWRREYGGMKTDQLKRLKELERGEPASAAEAGGLGPDARQADPGGGGAGKPLSPARRRSAVARVRQSLGVSERRACRTLDQHRSTQRRARAGRMDEAALTEAIVGKARAYGRHGYRRVTALLRADGWHVNPKRVERIWRREGLKVPAKQPKRSRLRLNDGSCVRLRPQRRDHVWSYDFVEDRTHDGRKYRVLNVIDEFTREALAMRVDRKLNFTDVIDVLTDLFILRGPPAFVRSDNGPEFVAQAVRAWIEAVGAKTAYIEPGSPWENGCVEAFNARFRDELLDGEIFYTLAEAKTVIEGWRRDFNAVRPHSALGWRPPAPETIVPLPITPTVH